MPTKKGTMKKGIRFSGFLLLLVSFRPCGFFSHFEKKFDPEL
jgi:hypothetical protein